MHLLRKTAVIGLCLCLFGPDAARASSVFAETPPPARQITFTDQAIVQALAYFPVISKLFSSRIFRNTEEARHPIAPAPPDGIKLRKLQSLGVLSKEFLSRLTRPSTGLVLLAILFIKSYLSDPP